MNKNRILDFIFETIQWGNKKDGEKFYSEKQLSIKFNSSQSTSKSALALAEGLNLLKAQKGKGRIVQNFAQNIGIKHFIKLNSDNPQIHYSKKSYSFFTTEEWLFFNNHFENKDLKYLMIFELFENGLKLAKCFVGTNNIKYVHSFINSKNLDEQNFSLFLKNNKLLIQKIFQSISIIENQVAIKKKVFAKNNYLLEESVLVIEPQFFNLKMNFEFPFF